jgi:hypothetical protein
VDYFSNDTLSQSGYGCQVAGLECFVESPVQARIVMEDISYDGINIFQIDKMQLAEKQSGLHTVISRISGMVSPIISVSVSCVESLYYPNTFALKQPIHGIQLNYEFGTSTKELMVAIPSMEIVLLESSAPPSTSAVAEIELPCSIKYSLDEVKLWDSPKPSSRPTVFVKLFGTIHQLPPDPFNPQKCSNKAILNIHFEAMENEMLTLNSGRLQTTIADSSFQELQNLHFQAKDGIATAGFSSIDWDGILGGGTIEQQQTMKLPNACIEPLELGLDYKGIVVESQTR